MLYRFARAAFTPLVNEFFSRIEVLGSPLIEQGPLLVVANHPNQMMDPLLIASSFDRPCWFLAKSTLFAFPPVAWTLKNLHMIPVYRKQDDPAQMHRNADSLAEAESRLVSGAAVVVFPEGTSLGERKLATIKTGGARIALQAEQATGFKTGVRIQAIGLTYSSLTDFKSSVTIAISEPIVLRDWQATFEADAQAAVRQLTAEIEQRIRSVSVEVPERDQARLVERISLVARSFRAAEGREPDDFQLMNRIAARVQALAPKHPELKRAVESDISEYLALAGNFGLAGSESLETPARSWSNVLRFAAVFFGVLTHCVPYKVVSRIAQKYEHDPVLLASAKFTHALWAYPATYFLLALLLYWVSGSISAAGLCFVALPLLGHYTNEHLSWAQLMLLSTFWPTRSRPIEILRRVRDELMQKLLKLDQDTTEAVTTTAPKESAPKES